MKKAIGALAMLAGLMLLGVLFATGALAAGTVTFFHGGNGTAGWVTGQDAPGDTDGQAIRLVVPDASSFAGATLNDVGATAPVVPPKFYFKSTVTGASGGAPRLVIEFSDATTTSPSNIELRPLSWVKDTWTLENGTSNDWDNNGGTCGFLYEKSYATVLACHAGKTVKDVFVVSDVGGSISSFTHYIDDITYGEAMITTGPTAAATPTPTPTPTASSTTTTPHLAQTGGGSSLPILPLGLGSALVVLGIARLLVHRRMSA